MEDPALNKGPVKPAPEPAVEITAALLGNSIVLLKKRLEERGKGLEIDKILAMVRLFGVVRNIIFMPDLPKLLSKIHALGGRLLTEEKEAGNQRAFALYRKWHNSVQQQEKRLAIMMSAGNEMAEAVARTSSRPGELTLIIEQQLMQVYSKLHADVAAMDDYGVSSEQVASNGVHCLCQCFVVPVNNAIVIEGLFGDAQEAEEIAIKRIRAQKSNDPKVIENTMQNIMSKVNLRVDESAMWGWVLTALNSIGEAHMQWRQLITAATHVEELFRVGKQVCDALHSLDGKQLEKGSARFAVLLKETEKLRQGYDELGSSLKHTALLRRSKNDTKENKFNNYRSNGTFCFIDFYKKVEQQLYPEIFAINTDPAQKQLWNGSQKQQKKDKKKTRKRSSRSTQRGVKYIEIQEKSEQQPHSKQKENAVPSVIPVAQPVVPPIPAPALITEDKILRQYSFDQRIFRSEVNDFYHRHSWFVHPLLKKYGFKSPYINKTHPTQVDIRHLLPGMVLYENIEAPTYCFFCMTEDPTGTCYHRECVETTQEQMFTVGEGIETAAQEIAEDGDVVQPHVTRSTILKDDNFKRVIYDEPFDCVLVVFKKCGTANNSIQ